MGCSPRCFHWPLSRAGRCRAGHTSRSARPLCGGYTHTCQTPALQRNVSLAVAAHSSLTKPYKNTYNSPLPIFLNTGWVHIHPQVCRRGNKLIHTFTLLFAGGYAAIHPKITYKMDTLTTLLDCRLSFPSFPGRQCSAWPWHKHVPLARREYTANGVESRGSELGFGAVSGLLWIVGKKGGSDCSGILRWPFEMGHCCDCKSWIRKLVTVRRDSASGLYGSTIPLPNPMDRNMI